MRSSRENERAFIDTDDFRDRKPVSLTKAIDKAEPEVTGRISAHEQFRRRRYLALVIAVVPGFYSGLLRSAITILAYLFAMPIAIWAMTFVAPMIGGQADASWMQSWPLFFGIFLLAGMVLGKLMRMVLDEAIGPGAGIGDRLAGAALGAVRVGLVAVTLVMIFDQLVPGIASRDISRAPGCDRCCRRPRKPAFDRCHRRPRPRSTG